MIFSRVCVCVLSMIGLIELGMDFAVSQKKNIKTEVIYNRNHIFSTFYRECKLYFFFSPKLSPKVVKHATIKHFKKFWWQKTDKIIKKKENFKIH